MINIKNLIVKYGNKKIFNNLTFKFEKGRIYGVKGKNGIGKTTLINCILCLKNFKGEIFVKGLNVKKFKKDIKKNIGVVPESKNYFKLLTVKQHLNFVYDIYRLSEEYKKKKIKKIISLFNLDKYKNIKMNKCSKGVIQKTLFAMSLINKPDILLLDEPFDGIDFDTYKKIRNYLLNYINKNRLILLISHNINIVNEFSDVIVKLRKRKIVYENKK